jgi:hypothetical protein
VSHLKTFLERIKTLFIKITNLLDLQGGRLSVTTDFSKTIEVKDWRVRVMVFSATFNNIWVILWQSVLLVEETRVPRENHWSAASHWQILSHNVVSSTPRLSGIQTHNVSGDSHWLAYVVVNPPIIRSLPRQPLKDWEICCLHVDLTWRYKHFWLIT